jgi:hypothetical protein
MRNICELAWTLHGRRLEAMNSSVLALSQLLLRSGMPSAFRQNGVAGLLLMAFMMGKKSEDCPAWLFMKASDGMNRM